MVPPTVSWAGGDHRLEKTWGMRHHATALYQIAIVLGSVAIVATSRRVLL